MTVSWGDVPVLAVLALIVGLVIRGMIRDRKKGCCHGCKGCSMAGSCNQTKGK